MKRSGWRAAILGVLMVLVVLLPGRAGAHVVNVLARVNLIGSGLTVSFLDAYDQRMEELVVKVSVEEIGGKPGKTITLTEGPKGVYTGTLGAPPSQKYQVSIAFDMAGDKHQALLSAEQGKDQAEVMLPVLGLGTDAESAKNLWLWGGAILVLAAATAYALYRTPKDTDEEAEV